MFEGGTMDPTRQHSIVDAITWSSLFNSYVERMNAYACQEVIAGFQALGFSDRADSFKALSKRLQELIGWHLEPVDGLLPNHSFFHLLRNRSYPIAVRVRKPSEIDFAELPDSFHDQLGHLPLLLLPAYTDFLQEYARVAVEHLQFEPAIEALGRIYWYTVETGLVRQNGKTKICGAAILTSHRETQMAMSERAVKRRFTLEDVSNLDFDHKRVQDTYFVMDSLDDYRLISHQLSGLAENIRRSHRERSHRRVTDT